MESCCSTEMSNSPFFRHKVFCHGLMMVLKTEQLQSYKRTCTDFGYVWVGFNLLKYL